MPRLRLVLATAALAAGTGCSHPQPSIKVARPSPSPARVAARLPAPTPVTATAPAPARPDDAIFFDFDSALLRDDARPVLQGVADLLRRQPATVRIEGNCDEVGTTEYNIALGEERSRSAKEYLERLGVPAKLIATISYGAQRPRFGGHDETAHAKNRRDDLVVQ